ncbi:hypothetical protein ACFX5Q_24730 [Mesorhizobium sp. IMUNJ 23033]|uniref:hypothetical protein n=1 Tax=Mesorhizobium sp. IMUNJ 23033 TaxID=3378039 RepID=UPI00384E378C
MSQLIHNECVKMSANYFNSMGIVALATGVIVPVLSIGIVGTPISLWTFLPPVLGLVVSLLLIIGVIRFWAASGVAVPAIPARRALRPPCSPLAAAANPPAPSSCTICTGLPDMPACGSPIDHCL